LTEEVSKTNLPSNLEPIKPVFYETIQKNLKWIASILLVLIKWTVVSGQAKFKT
jgi:hypothetical protein